MAEAGKPRVDQIVGECFVKAAHIILGARICHSAPTASKQGPKCWVRAHARPGAACASHAGRPRLLEHGQEARRAAGARQKQSAPAGGLF